MAKLSVAIIGGGPIGVECALRAAAQGYSVRVYEAEEPGAFMRRWGHVRFFSPWELNRSLEGEKLLKERGVELAKSDEYPYGRQFLEEYLLPLVEGLREDGVEFFTQTRVREVSRRDALKGDFIGNSRRGESPFVLWVDGPEGERFDEAQVVIDASGVLGQPRRLGPGGLPAVGERGLGDVILHGIPDFEGADQARFQGKRVLVVGAGHSAATTLDALLQLRLDEPATEVFWSFRDQGKPYPELSDDPLPERARLNWLGNRAAQNEIDGVRALGGTSVQAFERTDEGVAVCLRGADGEEEQILVDLVVANTGYRPDLSLFQELQVHLCYASDGPMKLAASLLAQSGGGADCLAQESGGAEVLVTPEPNFFVLGAKSYGRNSQFILKIGFEQIQSIMELLANSSLAQTRSAP